MGAVGIAGIAYAVQSNCTNPPPGAQAGAQPSCPASRGHSGGGHWGFFSGSGSPSGAPAAAGPTSRGGFGGFGLGIAAGS